MRDLVLSMEGIPIASDFGDYRGSPIIINRTTGKLYVLTTAGVVVEIGGGGGTVTNIIQALLAAGMDQAPDPEPYLIPGTPGAAGPSGPTGAQGLALYMLPDVADPEPGPPGPQGVAGATGSAGAPGATGPVGPPVYLLDEAQDGEQGPPGQRGSDGTSGPAGSSGPALYFLADPLDGEQGWPGPKNQGPDPFTGYYNPGSFVVPTAAYVVMGDTCLIGTGNEVYIGTDSALVVI